MTLPKIDEKDSNVTIVVKKVDPSTHTTTTITQEGTTTKLKRQYEYDYTQAWGGYGIILRGDYYGKGSRY